MNGENAAAAPMTNIPGNLRLAKELEALNKIPVENITAGPEGDDILIWRAYVLGEEGSAYDGGIFTIRMVFSVKWPEELPEIRFLTSIFHPGVNESTGETSMFAIMFNSENKDGSRSRRRDTFGPLTVRKILENVVGFFTRNFYLHLASHSSHKEVLTHCIFNEKAASQLVNDFRGFEETASRWTYRYAK